MRDHVDPGHDETGLHERYIYERSQNKRIVQPFDIGELPSR